MSDERETVEEEPLPPGHLPCPTCAHPVEPRQLVCLSCGARVALDHRRSIVSEPLVPLIVALIVVGAGLFGFAISEITSDSGEASGGAAQTAPAAPQVVDGEGQPARTEPTSTQRERPAAPAAPSNPLAWPRGVTAHTVVLVTTGDRPAGLAVAREARSSGLEAGLLPSDPYDLGTGLWIVFSGRFTTREGAARQAAQLAERYPGAYPQLIQRSQ
jgi:predicted nucleic acid-binding Zn ribbon protein